MDSELGKKNPLESQCIKSMKIAITMTNKKNLGLGTNFIINKNMQLQARKKYSEKTIFSRTDTKWEK